MKFLSVVPSLLFIFITTSFQDQTLVIILCSTFEITPKMSMSDSSTGDPHPDLFFSNGKPYYISTAAILKICPTLTVSSKLPFIQVHLSYESNMDYVWFKFKTQRFSILWSQFQDCVNASGQYGNHFLAFKEADKMHFSAPRTTTSNANTRSMFYS